jgi:hypothetical protein
MSGNAGSVVTPSSPRKPDPAGAADPGQAAEGKAGQAQAGQGTSGSSQAQPHKPPQTEEEKEKKTSWIEIELVGEDDKPIPGERFEVVMPDGTVASGTLDVNGKARVEGIEPGSTCKVSFPALDKEAWEKV